MRHSVAFNDERYSNRRAQTPIGRIRERVLAIPGTTTQLLLLFYTLLQIIQQLYQS